MEEKLDYNNIPLKVLAKRRTMTKAHKNIVLQRLNSKIEKIAKLYALKGNENGFNNW